MPDLYIPIKVNTSIRSDALDKAKAGYLPESIVKSTAQKLADYYSLLTDPNRKLTGDASLDADLAYARQK